MPTAIWSPIPTELVERMRAAGEFGKGLLARTQMFYAALSYKLHLEVPEDLTGRMFELYPEYSLVAPLEASKIRSMFWPAVISAPLLSKPITSILYV